MSAVLLPRPPLTEPPEPYDGMPVSEADYWEFYYLPSSTVSDITH
jgi:hypothetical protein